jgi:hypothetical protein
MTLQEATFLGGGGGSKGDKDREIPDEIGPDVCCEGIFEERAQVSPEDSLRFGREILCKAMEWGGLRSCA